MGGSRIDVVLVKLCAVVIVVLSMQSLTGYVAYYVNTEEANFLAVSAFLLNFGLPLVFAGILWFFPATVIGDVSGDTQPIEGGVDIVVLAVTLVGLYTLVFGVIDLAYYESFRATQQEIMDPDGFGTYSPSAQTVAGRVTNIIQIVLGLSLLVGRRQIARLLSRVRTAGVSTSHDPD